MSFSLKSYVKLRKVLPKVLSLFLLVIISSLLLSGCIQREEVKDELYYIRNNGDKPPTSMAEAERLYNKFKRNYEMNMYEPMETNIIKHFGDVYCEARSYSMNQYASEFVKNKADSGELFALSLYDCIGEYHDTTYLLKAVEAGSNTAIYDYAIYLKFGFREVDVNLEESEKYYNLAYRYDRYISYMALVDRYVSNEDVAKLCKIVGKGYRRYGLEFIEYTLVALPDTTKYIQDSCKIFGDKTYTLDQYKDLSYLLDVGTDEAIYIYTIEKSRSDRKGRKWATKSFKKLSDSTNPKIKYNSMSCLARAYHYGHGVRKNKKLAREYATEAAKNGVLRAQSYDIDQGKGYSDSYKLFDEARVYYDYYGKNLCYEKID